MYRQSMPFKEFYAIVTAVATWTSPVWKVEDRLVPATGIDSVEWNEPSSGNQWFFPDERRRDKIMETTQHHPKQSNQHHNQDTHKRPSRSPSNRSKHQSYSNQDGSRKVVEKYEKTMRMPPDHPLKRKLLEYQEVPEAAKKVWKKEET